MIRRHRRERIQKLLQQIEAWEIEGRDLFGQVVELTDPDDDLSAECRRVLDLLAVPADARLLADAAPGKALTSGAALPAPEGIFPRYVEPAGEAA
jgi:methionyl-tRNA synthetase